jgi:phosphoglycolate phosphatase
MSRRFELLVFDWDGTLMDSTAIIVASLQHACREMQLPIPSDENAQHIIGLGLHDAMAHVLPGLARSVYPELVECYGRHFRARSIDVPLFSGAAHTLRQLKARGHLLGIATGKSRRGLDRTLAATGLEGVFDATRCGEESAGKPHPGMLHDLMSQLQVSPDVTLMIGDTTHDLRMAINAGVAHVAAAYGAHPRAQLCELAPLACLDRPEELCKWLEQHA